MILRNVAIRHGRKALAVPLQRSCLRALTTSPPNQYPPSAPQQEIRFDPSMIRPYKDKWPKTPTAPAPPDPNSKRSKRKREHQGYWTKKHQAEEQKMQVSRELSKRHHIEQTTGDLGADVESHYEPWKILVDPPRPEDVTLELLMASQAHLGHATSLWNPMNQRYIYGVRQGIHIISLEETAAHLRRAAKVVQGVCYHGGLVLFVGTRRGHAPAVVKAAELAQGCHLFTRWKPGTITNKNQLLNGCGMAVVNKDDQVVDGFSTRIDEMGALKPDLVVVMNPKENYIMLHECGLNNIPTIGVLDTNSDPTWITYPIPANDDSIRCISVIAGVLGRAGEEGQRQRLKAAAKNEVTWLPPVGLGLPEFDETEEEKKVRLDRERREAVNIKYIGDKLEYEGDEA